jgi:DNA-binding CsgD family transcriptional regulator
MRPHDLGAFARQDHRAELSHAGGSFPMGATALTAAELRLLPMLSTHLSFPEIAEELFLSGHTTADRRARARRGPLQNVPGLGGEHRPAVGTRPDGQANYRTTAGERGRYQGKTKSQKSSHRRPGGLSSSAEFCCPSDCGYCGARR